MQLLIRHCVIALATSLAWADDDAYYAGTADPTSTIEPTYAASTLSPTAAATEAATVAATAAATAAATESVYAYTSSDAIGVNFFADTQETYYNGYQQAWRYLGWYVKCGYPSDRYDEQSHHSGSGDNGNDYEGNNYCQRYLIWAAYVDKNYQGGGTGEYHYFDPYTGAVDYTACNRHGNGRCAPMDCHMSNTTTWSLMGIFKEASFFGNDAFFEQLFKHEGVCVWDDDDTYEFMSEMRENAWTQGCVNTGVRGNSFYFDGSSNYLYLDLKPTWNGNMTYGLYTDYTCKTEYDGLDVDADTVSKRMGLLYGDYLEQWNDALEVYKVCQPCRAYNLNNGYSNGNNNRKLEDGSSDPNGGYFTCNDDAGYTNVNQCMKFRTHADLEVATWEDLVTATNQGGILQVKVGGTIFGSARMSAEENEYMVTKRKKQIAIEQKKAAHDAAVLAALAPQAKSWAAFGDLTFGIGALFILLVLLRTLRRCCCCNRVKEIRMEEPLLLPGGGVR